MSFTFQPNHHKTIDNSLLTTVRYKGIHTSVSFFNCVIGLTKNKRQRMRRMGRQSCYSFTVVIQARYPTFHGTRVRIGLLLVWPKITYYKFGRWQRTSTTTKTICLETTPPRLPSSEGTKIFFKVEKSCHVLCCGN